MRWHQQTESEGTKRENTERKTDGEKSTDKIGKRREPQEKNEKMSELLYWKRKNCATEESVVKVENEHKNKLIKWK